MQKISISELAKKSGYTYTHIARIFTGQGTPSWECARKLAALTGMSLDEFAHCLDAAGKGSVSVPLWPLEEE